MLNEEKLRKRIHEIIRGDVQIILGKVRKALLKMDIKHGSWPDDYTLAEVIVGVALWVMADQRKLTVSQNQKIAAPMKKYLKYGSFEDN